MLAAVHPAYPESDLVPLSALQHRLFCSRQCALIHLEQGGEENRLRVRGWTGAAMKFESVPPCCFLDAEICMEEP